MAGFGVGKDAFVDDAAALLGQQVLLLDVRAVRPDARDALAQQPGVVHVEPFGAGFHVRGPDAELDPVALGRALGAAGHPGAVIESLEASLEDVFIASVRGQAVETQQAEDRERRAEQ